MIYGRYDDQLLTFSDLINYCKGKDWSYRFSKVIFGFLKELRLILNEIKSATNCIRKAFAQTFLLQFIPHLRFYKINTGLGVENNLIHLFVSGLFQSDRSHLLHFLPGMTFHSTSIDLRYTFLELINK